jgi:hypothetical protein
MRLVGSVACVKGRQIAVNPKERENLGDLSVNEGQYYNES